MMDAYFGSVFSILTTLIGGNVGSFEAVEGFKEGVTRDGDFLGSDMATGFALVGFKLGDVVLETTTQLHNNKRKLTSKTILIFFFDTFLNIYTWVHADNHSKHHCTVFGLHIAITWSSIIQMRTRISGLF